MAGGKPNILVIDDNKDHANMIKAMLQVKGYDITIKADTINLEDSIQKIMPDLIIMDMLLSGVDGCEICKTLKNNAYLAHIPIMMISAHPDARKECIDAGADSFLEKPFDIKNFFRSGANFMA